MKSKAGKGRGSLNIWCRRLEAIIRCRSRARRAESCVADDRKMHHHRHRVPYLEVTGMNQNGATSNQLYVWRYHDVHMSGNFLQDSGGRRSYRQGESVLQVLRIAPIAGYIYIISALGRRRTPFCQVPELVAKVKRASGKIGEGRRLKSASRSSANSMNLRRRRDTSINLQRRHSNVAAQGEEPCISGHQRFSGDAAGGEDVSKISSDANLFKALPLS